MELLRLKLIYCRKQVRRMSGYKYDNASLIQKIWREFDERNEKRFLFGYKKTITAIK